MTKPNPQEEKIIEKVLKDKIEIELENNIKIFNKAYKDWNNKKLFEEEREKAQNIVDKMTDAYTDSYVSSLKLKYYRLGKQKALQMKDNPQEEKRISKKGHAIK